MLSLESISIPYGYLNPPEVDHDPTHLVSLQVSGLIL